jgi:chromosome segregation ATPase
MISDAIIVGLIAAGASIAGTLASYLKNSNTNKKKFKSLELGFGDLKSKFNGLELGFGDLNSKFNNLELGFGDLNSKFNNLELGFGDLNSKFNGLEQRQENFEKKLLYFETNAMKHMELDPNGATMKKIDGMAADITVLKQDVKGIKRYAHTLDGILLDKKVLTNQQAEMLNTHLDS